MEDLKNLLEIAESAARATGAILRAGGNRSAHLSCVTFDLSCLLSPLSRSCSDDVRQTRQKMIRSARN